MKDVIGGSDDVYLGPYALNKWNNMVIAEHEEPEQKCGVGGFGILPLRNCDHQIFGIFASEQKELFGNYSEIDAVPNRA